MLSLDGIEDLAMDETYDYGRASFAFGGEWKTPNSSSRVDATLFPFLPLHVSAATSQTRRLGGSLWWPVTAVSPVQLSTGRGGDGAGRPLGALGRAPRRLQGDKVTLDANPTGERQLQEPLPTPTLPYAGAGPFSSQLQRDHTRVDPLEMEVGEGREPGGVFTVKIILSSLPLPESKVRPGVESPPPSLGAAAHARGQPGKRAPLMSSGRGPT